MTSKPEKPFDPLALPRKVRQFILDHQLIPENSIVFAAVSGGADSLALLLLLESLKDPLSFSLRCVHVDHQLRGAESDEDRNFVTNWCQKLNIPLTIERFNVRKQSEERRAGIEQVARDLRLDVFQKLVQSEARHGQPVVIALAHHLDDQAETLLMNLGRGSGLDGLAGMRPKDNPVIRPLLQCRRKELEDWLQACDVQWRHDPSNDSDFTIRNRLRHHLLPAWETLLGYDPVSLLGSTADNLSADRQLIEQVAAEALSSCLDDTKLCADPFLALQAELQTRVFQKYWKKRTGHGQNLERKHLQLICRWTKTARKWQSLDLPDHWRLQATGDAFVLEQPFRLETKADWTAFFAPLQVPGKTRLRPFHQSVEAQWVRCGVQAGDEKTSVTLRADRIHKLVFRTRRPGDRIRLSERQEPLLLKKWMQQIELAPEERNRLLVLADGSNIVWIPGYAAWMDCRMEKNSRTDQRCVRLTISCDPD